MSFRSNTTYSPPPYKRHRKNEYTDPYNPPPSLVVHVSNLNNKATESNLLESLSRFGHIAYVSVIPKRHSALVEFETMHGSRACVEYAKSHEIHVSGYPAVFHYSTSQVIQRIGLESEEPNNILVLTIYNVHYPITVEVIHKISKHHGTVKRITISKLKGKIQNLGVQALVEFDSVETARRAKHALNGADIYADCCTIKCEFAKINQIQVKKNDSESWDFTFQTDEQSGGHISLSKTLVYKDQALQPSGIQTVVQPHVYAYNPNSSSFMSGIRPSSSNGPQVYEQNNILGYKSAYERSTTNDRSITHGNRMVMVFGLNHENFNPDKLFNLMCCYGNPIKIKFNKNKADTALVEMGDGQEVNQVCKYLANTPCFGTTLNFRPNKSESLKEPPQPFNMLDGTPSFKDFTKGVTSRLLRFTTSEMAARNRLYHPSKSLYCFNAPPSIDEKELRQVFESRGASITGQITIFKSKYERTKTGLCEFDSTEKAVEAMILVNHTPIDSEDSPYPFTLKLAFYGKDRP